MNSKAKGYLLGAIAAATYGMNPLFALPLYETGMDPDSVLFFRYLFAIPLLGVMLKARGRTFRLKRGEVPPLLAMGLLVAVSSLTLFQSYNFMDAGIASTLLFVYPIMVALIMAFVFKEKLTLQTVLCIALALGGIGLLYKTADGSTLSLTGTALVMVSALSYAVYIVGINQSSLKHVATLKVTFYVLLFGVTLFLGRILYGGRPDSPRKVVPVGQPNRSRSIPHSHLVPLHHRGHPVYRLDADRHPGRPGAGNGYPVRNHGIRREANPTRKPGARVDYHSRDECHCRRRHHSLSNPFQENVSPTGRETQ